MLAALAAGYVMALVGLWAGRVPRLVAIDIADFGRRYMVSDRPSAWLLGFFSHLVNSVLLAYVWAALVVPSLDWPRWLSGGAYGVVLSFFFAGALVAPMAGYGLFGRRAGATGFALTSLLAHLVWGVTLGLLYAPP